MDLNTILKARRGEISIKCVCIQIDVDKDAAILKGGQGCQGREFSLAP